MKNKGLVAGLLFLVTAICVIAQQHAVPTSVSTTPEGKIRYADYSASVPQVAISQEVVVDYLCISNPGNPPTGSVRVYCDSGTGKLTCINHSGSACLSTSGGTVTAVTGTAPIVSSGGTTPAISCPTCTTAAAPGRTISGPTDTVLSTDVAPIVKLLEFTNATGTTETVPDAGSSGFANNPQFNAVVLSGAAPVLFQNSSVSTFTTCSGILCQLPAASFTAVAGQSLHFSSPDNTNWIVQSSVNSSLANSPSPSATYTFFLATSSTCNVPSLTGTTVCARNNQTSAIDFEGTDAASVINQAISRTSTTGGHFFFKQAPGGYPANSATGETASGCANFLGSGNALAYVIGIPSTTPYANGVQWIFEGENGGVWQGEGGSSANTTGTYINVTSTAISSVAAGSFIAGFFPRPVTNCNLVQSNVSNSFVFKNIGIRFPTNQRGNEGGFVTWFGADVKYKGTIISDFALTYSSMATGSAPVAGNVGTFGITSTVSGASNEQHFENTYAVGWDTCYDLQSEHITGRTMTAIYCNDAAKIGRSGTQVFHNSHIVKFIDQENLRGVTFGAQMQLGSRFTFDEYDLELGAANWYARTAGAWTETNCGFTNGTITYTAVAQGTGIVNVPALFSSCGTGFQLFQGIRPPNIALTTASDSFARPNASTLGPAWVVGTQSFNTGLKIIANAAGIVGAGNSVGYAPYNAQPFSNSQFSSATIASINASGSTFAEVTVLMSTNPAVQTYYTYYCSGAAAGGRGIIKVVAGSSTTLQSQTSAGCVANDTLELDVIQNQLTGVNTLIAYRNGLLDLTFTNPTTDSSITSGAPGINMVQSATGVVTMTNWIGGSLPTKTGLDSIYAKPVFAPNYNTLLNCASGASPAVCSSAAAGDVAMPTGATPTLQVNTTAVTANSQIFLQVVESSTVGTRLGVTCNSTLSSLVQPVETTRTAGSSFTIQMNTTLAANPACIHYLIVN